MLSLPCPQIPQLPAICVPQSEALKKIAYRSPHIISIISEARCNVNDYIFPKVSKIFVVNIDITARECYDLVVIKIVTTNYQTADNPAFEVFYLEDAHGVIADFSGNPPYEF